MQYRVRLGYKEVGSNLCGDPFFNNAGDWTTSGGWNLAAPSAEWTGATNGYLTYNTPIFTQYKRYRIKFTINADCATAYVKVFLGEYSSRKFSSQFLIKDYVYEGFCLAGTQLQFYAWSSILIGPPSITNVEVYELDWNDPVTDFEFINSILNFEQSTILDGTLINFANKIKVWGAALDYINTQALLDYTINIPTKIEYNNAGTWAEFHLGQICITDTEFSKGVADVVIGDSIAVDLVRKNITYAEFVSMAHNTILTVSENPGRRVAVHVVFGPSAGFYITGGIYQRESYVYDAFRLLRVLIIDAIGLEAIIDIPHIGEAHPVSLIQGVGLVSGATRIGEIPVSDRDVQDYGVNLSIETLLRELNCLYNIGLAIGETSGIPKITIDDKMNLKPNTIVFTLNNVNDANYKYEINPRNLKMGYLINYDNRLDASINLTSDQKMPENEVNLVSNFISDSYVIHEQLAEDTAQQYSNYFWIQLDGAFSWKTNIGGDEVYNQEIRIDDLITRQMTTLAVDYRNIGGVSLVEYTGTYIYTKKYDFELPIPIAYLLALRNTPYFRIVVNGFINTFGYLYSMEYNIIDENARFKLIGT